MIRITDRKYVQIRLPYNEISYKILYLFFNMLIPLFAVKKETGLIEVGMVQGYSQIIFLK